VIKGIRKSASFFVAHVAPCSVANPHFATRRGRLIPGFPRHPGLVGGNLAQTAFETSSALSLNMLSLADPQIGQEVDYLQQPLLPSPHHNRTG